MASRWDTAELQDLVADLTAAPGRSQRNAPKVFEVAANKIKKGLRREATGHDFLRDLPRHVEYDRIGDLDYEIGFNKVGQGELANIAAFGSINNAPVLDLVGPLRREIPHMVRHLGNDAEDWALGGKR